jgi:hypothetical protein
MLLTRIEKLKRQARDGAAPGEFNEAAYQTRESDSEWKLFFVSRMLSELLENYRREYLLDMIRLMQPIFDGMLELKLRAGHTLDPAVWLYVPSDIWQLFQFYRNAIVANNSDATTRVRMPRNHPSAAGAATLIEHFSHGHLNR